MKQILSKAISYDIYEKGLFGNKLRTWDYKSFIEAGNKGELNGISSFSIRYAGNSGASNFTKYNICGYAGVLETIKKFENNGAEKHLIKINESAPDEKLTIQGEICISERGYELSYSLEKGKMRDCMKNAIFTHGLQAKLLLQKYLHINSYNDICELLELYPDHVIEFSTYSMNLGSCFRRNTIIWEVRKY